MSMNMSGRDRLMSAWSKLEKVQMRLQCADILLRCAYVGEEIIDDDDLASGEQQLILLIAYARDALEDVRHVIFQRNKNNETRGGS